MCCRLFAGICLVLLAVAAGAEVRVEGVRTWAGPDHTRIVFDLSSPSEHRLFTLSGPDRVVVDMEGTRLDSSLVDDLGSSGVLQRVRTGKREGGTLRVVFDLAQSVKPSSFLVAPNETYGHRLVVDLQKPGDASRPTKTLPERGDDLVIAIDAGHGGEDPGAVGPSGVFEKDVVFAVARRLERLVDRQPGMQALMIRDGDYYIGLRERTRRARDARADLFVSVHADAFRDRSVRGGSVFVLSNQGASSEMARMMAASENRADRIGGVSLDGKDDVVATVLMDLSRAHNVEASHDLAEDLLGGLKQVGRVHRRSVEHAGFAVLKSLDMPSVLVELAFLSNPEEERRLSDPGHQGRLAGALHKGILRYADEHLGGVGRTAGGGEYVVRRGDTLSEIARRHEVSLNRLRAANDIDGDVITVGSRLLIP